MKVKEFVKNNKITVLVFGLILILFLAVGIPSLARFKNRNPYLNISVWDGTIASKYYKGNGSKTEPYVISNGNELAYFQEQLLTTDYEDTYFILKQDIILNEGVFNYKNNKIEYILDDVVYYLKPNTNEYYDNDIFTNLEGEINFFQMSNNFKGNLDGNFHNIYGLYLTDEKEIELAFFKELEGIVSNLYFENAFVYGGNISSILAAKTTSSTIKNVIANGLVIGNESLLPKETVYETSDKSIITDENQETIIKIPNLYLYNSEIISATLTGEYEIIGNPTQVTIENNSLMNGVINIDLSSNYLNQLQVEIETTTPTTVILTNLKYEVEFKYGIASLLVGTSTNSHLFNVVSKGKAIGEQIASGLIGLNISSNLTNAYNEAEIVGNLVGGIVGVIENNQSEIELNNIYHNHDDSHVIGDIINNDFKVMINNSFSLGNNETCFNKVDNASLELNNFHYSNNVLIGNGQVIGTYYMTNINNLKDENYLINNLLLSKYQNQNHLKNNENSVWIFEEEYPPILFIDDEKNKVVQLNVNLYSWNNYSYDLDAIYLTSDLKFNVEEVDSLKPLQEIYYYVSEEVLTRNELENHEIWEEYQQLTTINEEGSYIIYIKALDYNNKVYYLNSDELKLDLVDPLIEISMDDLIWDKNEEPEYIYLDRQKTIYLNSEDDFGIKSLQYFLTDKKTDVEDITEWIDYEQEIEIKDLGNYIFYGKAEDKSGRISYANSGILVYDGYQVLSMHVGRDSNTYENPLLTKDSSLRFHFKYSNYLDTNLDNLTHNIVSNLKLPTGVKITLVDKKFEKIYTYVTETSAKKYSFSLFKEIGKVNGALFEEHNYLNIESEVEEEFILIFDFLDAEISKDYLNFQIYLEVEQANQVIRPTLYETIPKFSIYNQSENNELYLVSNYETDGINLTDNQTVNIDLLTGLNKIYQEEEEIINSNYNGNISLEIKIIDDLNQVIDSKYYSHLEFKIGQKKYYPTTDNVLYIDLSNGLEEISFDLEIKIHDSNVLLNNGKYYLQIRSKVNYGFDEKYSNVINIPLIVSNNKRTHGFKVINSYNNQIIKKTFQDDNLTFEITHDNLKNATIKVTLWQKKYLTGFNQEYELVDFNDYLINKLIGEDNKYLIEPANDNKFNFKLDLDAFAFNGYKIVFSLYENNFKISSLDKYLLVK